MFSDFESAYRRFRELPSPMQIAYGLGFIFLAVNLLIFLALASSNPWKIDSGVATLVGAIVGLCVVAWQTGRGFKNLVKSQDNQARLEREAREHKAELDQGARAEEIHHRTRTLLAALRAEISHIHAKAHEASVMSLALSEVYMNYAKQRAPTTTKELTFSTFDAPIFKMNLADLGLLGTSLGADIIRALSRADGKDKKLTVDQPMQHDFVSRLYKGNHEELTKWTSDLFHVAMRIRALEEGKPDPGSLNQTQTERYAKLDMSPLSKD